MIPRLQFREAFYLGATLLVVMAQSAAVAQDNGAGSSDSMNFPGAPVNNVLDMYEQLSGIHLIRDSSLNAQGALPPITLNFSGLNKTERLKFIQEALLLDGVTIVPIDDKTAKVLATPAQQKNPRSEGLKIYANTADLPADDEVVSYYMPLSYISPLDVQAIFTAHAPVHTYGAYVPVPSAQAIILTENASVIRQLVALKELIDVPPARVASEFIQLDRADAEKVADLLNKLLDPKTAAAAGGPQGGGNVIVPPALGNDSPLLNEHNLISGSAQIVPDPRSNRLLVITRPVNMPLLKQMIAALDQPDIYMTPQRRPLRYVLAQDILPALEEALAQGKDEEDQVKNQQTGAAGNKNPNQPNAAPSNSASSGGTGSGTSITPELSAPATNDAPTVVTIGKTRLMADNRSNSIVVFGSPDVTSRVFDMIDELDHKPLQVYLATVIGSLTVTEGQEFGIDILQKFQKVGQGGLASSLENTSSSASAANLPSVKSLTSNAGFPLLSGLTLYGAIGSTLDAYVQALQTTNRFKIISRPSVYTTNNTKATIASGSRIPVPSNITSSFGATTTSTNGLQTTASIDYENVLVDLEIVPLINANHEVTMRIRQTDNTVGANNNISGNNVPTINTQEINTEVTVPDKSTVVIGGLIKDQATRDETGVPWLSDIPVLGYLFKDTTKNKERDELIIMIQPTVVETDADQIAENAAETQRTILGREATAAATGTVETTETSTTNIFGGNKSKPIATQTTQTKVTVPATKDGPVHPDVSNGTLIKDLPPPPSH